MITNKTLPIGKIILESFWVAYQQRRTFARAIFIPFIALTIFSIGQRRFGFDGELFSSLLQGNAGTALLSEGLQSILFALIAVPCHRIVLLGPNSVPAKVHLGWSNRETRFVIWLILFNLTLRLAWFAFVLPIGFVIGNAAQFVAVFDPVTASYLISYSGPLGALLLVYYIYARLSLVFPSIAIDAPQTLPAAWSLSRGNGWRLVAMMTIFYFIYYIFWRLFPIDNIVLLVSFMMLGYLLFVLAIIAWSLAYSKLKSFEE
jgi:hypothetical protein